MTARMIRGTQQLDTAPSCFLHVFAEWIPARIVEIGCGSGLWSACLAVLVGTKTRVYGFDNRSLRRPWLATITWRDVDCWSATREIAGLVAEAGPTLLLCDGGNKPREVNTFAVALKPGDVVMAHDFSPTRQEFSEVTRNLIWPHCEITDADVAETLSAMDCRPWHADIMREALWGSWRRWPWTS